MSTTLPKRHLAPHSKRRGRPPALNRLECQKPTKCIEDRGVFVADEVAFLVRAIWIMAILAVAPVAIVLIVLYFYPEVFMIPITPG